jgi:hypothetical protein
VVWRKPPGRRSIDTAWIVNYTEVVRFYDGHGNNFATFTEPVHK